MNLFIDECLSPKLARDFNATGQHVAKHPLDFGGRGMPDHTVLSRCLKEDLVIVTANAVDFRALVAKEEIHPGLIILPCLNHANTSSLLHAAIDFLHRIGDPVDVMVNHVLEVSPAGDMNLYPLP
jgi:predicted nuclease of predicted toxin-antitoxin system